MTEASDPAAAAGSGESGCPVGFGGGRSSSSTGSSGAQSGGWLSGWLPWSRQPQGSATTGSAAATTAAAAPGDSSGCPVTAGAQQQGGAAGAYNPLVGDYRYGQSPHPHQKVPLSTARQASTIPRGGDKLPVHQPHGAEVWVYPSEQQYFNAMKKKGWDAQERDVPVVLAIHNAVNEQGWSRVCEWEALRAGETPETAASETPVTAAGVTAAATTGVTAAAAAGATAAAADGETAVGRPRLVEFRGRPNDVSPKAWLRTHVLGYKPPFDRHDWVVEAAAPSGAVRTRYVIDFYAGRGTPDRPVAMHLDVRPALDTPEAAALRLRMWAREAAEELRKGFASAAAAFARTGSEPQGGGAPDERARPPPPPPPPASR